MNTIESRIKDVRICLKYTQKEFGEKLSCNRDKISNIELGRSVPDELFIAHMSAMLNVNSQYILTGKGDMFLPVDGDLDYLMARYGENLSDNMKAVIKTILVMPQDRKELLEEIIFDFDKSRNLKDE